VLKINLKKHGFGCHPPAVGLGSLLLYQVHMIYWFFYFNLSDRTSASTGEESKLSKCKWS